jgi:hypothetical protein
MTPGERRPRTNHATASAVTRVRKTREQFQELTGYEAESISGLAQVDNGWSVEVDVVELRRVPDTASLLATYRVTIKLRLLVASVHTAKELGIDWWEQDTTLSTRARRDGLADENRRLRERLGELEDARAVQR